MSREPQLFWHSVGEHQIPADPAWLAPRERERASGLRFTKRRNDYLLGRLTTKLALAKALDLPTDLASLQRIEVRNQARGAERGAPEALLDGSCAPFDVSITDRAGWGVCALGPPGLRVGCDLELIEPRSDTFVADYLTRQEQAFVAAGPCQQARSARANLVWSAKESALKLLRTGLRRDTRSVEVWISGGDDRDGWCAFRACAVEGRIFSGWWIRFGVFLLTVAFEQPTDPPRALVDPPGLQRAKPSHRWLEAPLVAGAT